MNSKKDDFMNLKSKNYISEVLKELSNTLPAISEDEIESFVKLILSANRVFLSGAGRSRLAVMAFCMRLMHMGFTVHMVGEVTTPNIEPGDLLVIGSGSGETSTLSCNATKAKDIGANLALITISPQSSIGRIADVTVQIHAPSPKAAKTDIESIQPMGSLFEQSLFLLLDVVVLLLMENNKDTSADMFKKHANLE